VLEYFVLIGFLGMICLNLIRQLTIAELLAYCRTMNKAANLDSPARQPPWRVEINVTLSPSCTGDSSKPLHYSIKIGRDSVNDGVIHRETLL